MTVEMNVSFDKELITQLSQNKQEPKWMLEFRLKALEVYHQLPLPRLEKTKLDKWNIDQFIPFTDETLVGIGDLSEEIQNILEANTEDRSVLVQKNSKFVYKQLSKKLADKGVIYTDLDTALQEYPELVKKYFMKSVSFDKNKLLALHTALWSGGVFLYIPKHVEVEFPVQAIYLAAESGLLPHIIIVAEAYSSVTYVDHYFSENTTQNTVHNGVVEVYVGEGAKVRFATIHNFANGVYDYTHRHADVQRNGRIEWVIGEMNEGNTVSNNISILKEAGAEADSKLVFIGTGNQKTNFTSKIIHEGEHTNSQILSRGVMLDESTGIFNGITHMKKGAIKSNAEQAEKVLMLSEGARGDANPILLIDENDVMASHAASAGPVSREDIYYLMSRGIPKEEAERLIIHGFLTPVVSLIPIEGMQEKLEKVIERKLGK
ncbi:Fe-S cluster assembly protein SufD [Tepidibacillus fermentans]|uniref:Fe-S cluster assembly protein SufD n=1 Tax=Tepidibacillus fermentans TaxID=1281767 RepID=A0A4R3K6F9_9BACI|nr:Fe-S cluster assembly protein SufD [Tepidibacillus fermentans]TCS78474.1 Fe-S cluster assembly protein SufD [Tepidibacillus fermentans]